MPHLVKDHAQIEILIPTYNRSKDLLTNLGLLANQLTQDNLLKRVRILISDNSSPDDTEVVVDTFRSSHPEIDIIYFKQSENIGLEPNVVFILGKATADYIIWLGDDDFLDDGYLAYCLQKINTEPVIGCILTSVRVLERGGRTRKLRNEDFLEKALPIGYQSIWQFSHYAHQMSGILLKREGLVEAYLSKPEYRNPYLFIFFVVYRMSQYPSIYARKFRTSVTSFNEKDWSYNEVGLLDEVYKSYLYLLETYSEKQVSKLLLRFTVIHSYRLSFKSKRLRLLLKEFIFLWNYVNEVTFRIGLIKIFVKDFIKSTLR